MRDPNPRGSKSALTHARAHMYIHTSHDTRLSLTLTVSENECDDFVVKICRSLRVLARMASNPRSFLITGGAGFMYVS